MDIHLIWAQDLNAGIGKDGKLPWHISEDLKNFKNLTINSTILMGRKTWDSLPIKPLPSRRNIVLSKSNQDNVITLSSHEECIKFFEKENLDKIFIIGGRSIFEIFFRYANFLHITKINLLTPKVNEFFPVEMKQIEKKFKLSSKKQLSPDAIYTFWERDYGNS